MFAGKSVFEAARKRRKIEDQQQTENKQKDPEFSTEVVEASKAVREACLNGEFGSTENPFEKAILPLISELLDNQVPFATLNLYPRVSSTDVERAVVSLFRHHKSW